MAGRRVAAAALAATATALAAAPGIYALLQLYPVAAATSPRSAQLVIVFTVTPAAAVITAVAGVIALTRNGR